MSSPRRESWLSAKRKRIQFTLRMVFMLILFLAVGFKIFASHLHRAQRQHQAVSDIRAIGGNVYMHYTGPYEGGTSWLDPRKPKSSWWRDRLGDDFFDTVHRVELSGPATNDTMDSLRHVKSLRQLYLRVDENSTVTDRGMRQIGSLDTLQFLGLRGYKIMDDDLAHVTQLTQLTELYLEGTNVADKGLARLRRLTNLEAIGLSKYSSFEEDTYSRVDKFITDKGLVHLQAMRNLKRLGLQGNKITDRGLRYLATFDKLEELRIQHTDVTEEGVRQFKAARPNCNVRF